MTATIVAEDVAAAFTAFVVKCHPPITIIYNACSTVVLLESSY